jgi:hypothetical protein
MATAAAQASDAAVDDAAGKAAPAGTIESWLDSMDQRLARIESAVGLVLPVVNEVGAVAGAFVPAAGPVLQRLPLIESVVEGILGSLHTAFGGKLENLPRAGSTAAAPPAP